MNLYLLLGVLLVATANIGTVFCMTQLQKATLPPLLRKTAVLLIAELLILCSVDAVLTRFTLCKSVAVPIITFALVLSVYSVVMLTVRNTGKPLFRFLKRATGLAVIALVLEFAVFCAPCYTKLPSSETFPVSTCGVKLPDFHAEMDGPDVVIRGGTELVFPIERTDVKYVRFAVDSVDIFWKAECLITDENFSKNFQSVALTWMNPSQDTLQFAVNPYGVLHEIKLRFHNVENKPGVSMRSLTVMNVKPYAFSVLRFLLLTGVLCLLCAIQCFGWHRLAYNRRSLVHCEAAVLLLVLSVVGMCLVAPSAAKDLVPYDQSEGVGDYDPYAQTFDAWQHGQLHFHVETDPELLKLKNPYDHDARVESGVKFLWDKAYYDGKYYSYFGVAPVVLVYYPIWFLTGKLPTPAMATMIFSVLGMCFLFLLILAAVKKYGKEVNFLLLLCGLVSAAAASGLYLCAQFADRYYVAIAAGICFLCLYLWLGLEACMAKGQIARCLCLVGCALAIVCTVLSRPTLALYAVLLIPPFLGLIRRRELKISQKSAAVASFGVPLLLGAAVTMAYNAARFGSPFEFGAAYQMTVSNVNANVVRMSDFLSAIMYYFLAPLELGGVFPYLARRFLHFQTQSHYTYLVSGFGACMFPCIAAGYLLFWMATRTKRFSPEQRWLYRLAFLCPVVIAFLDFCVGGYIDRYLCDILPVLSIFSALLLLEVHGGLRSIPTLYREASRWIPVLLLLSPVLMLAIFLSSGEHFTVWHSYPEFYFKLREFLVFWR